MSIIGWHLVHGFMVIVEIPELWEYESNFPMYSMHFFHRTGVPELLLFSEGVIEFGPGGIKLESNGNGGFLRDFPYPKCSM